MKSLNNKKGSALLWTILLTVILTILLASITTAASMYFQYTTSTIIKQQAYFTARSAINVILERYTDIEISNSSLVKDDMIPSEGETIELTNFDFGQNMGTAKANIKLDDDDPDVIDVLVTSQYLDQEYKILAKVAREPIYFGGVAIKNLMLKSYRGTPAKFELDKDTDLYFYTYNKEKDAYNGTGASRTLKDDVVTFDTNAICTEDKANANNEIVIHGNLVTQGNAVLDTHATVAGYKFKGTVTFSNAANNHSKKIWDASHFIISNKSFDISDSQGKFSTSVINAFSNALNLTPIYCNNGKAFMNNCFGNYNLVNSDNFPAFKAFSDRLSAIVAGTEIGKTTADTKLEELAVKDTNNDGLATRYIQILSASNSISSTKDYAVNAIKNNTSGLPWPFNKMIGKALEEFNQSYNETVGKVFNSYGLTVMDISYVDFDSTTLGNYGDSGITPITYMFIEGNEVSAGTREEVGSGLYVRVKYGIKPEYASVIYGTADWLKDGIDGIASDWLGILKNTSYVIVELGKNATLELGTIEPHFRTALNNNADKPRTANNQKYFYSIYGQPGSRVILNDGVQVVGEIRVDTLEINGNATVTYSSSNGSQVAKQKIAEFWTVVNYDEGK